MLHVEERLFHVRLWVPKFVRIHLFERNVKRLIGLSAPPCAPRFAATGGVRT